MNWFIFFMGYFSGLLTMLFIIGICMVRSMDKDYQNQINAMEEEKDKCE